MSDQNESVASRLWRDRAQIREQERDDARARLRIAEEKVAILMPRTISSQPRMPGCARCSTQILRARTETERQMAALRGALMPLLDGPPSSVIRQ